MCYIQVRRARHSLQTIVRNPLRLRSLPMACRAWLQLWEAYFTQNVLTRGK